MKKGIPVSKNNMTEEAVTAILSSLKARDVVAFTDTYGDSYTAVLNQEVSGNDIDGFTLKGMIYHAEVEVDFYGGGYGHPYTIKPHKILSELRVTTGHVEEIAILSYQDPDQMLTECPHCDKGENNFCVDCMNTYKICSGCGESSEFCKGCKFPYTKP